MISDQERRQLADIEQHLALDARLADAFSHQPLAPCRRSNWRGWLVALALTALTVCAVLGTAVGAAISAAVTVAVIGLGSTSSHRSQLGHDV
jgi:hypothetical protein